MNIKSKIFSIGLAIMLALSLVVVAAPPSPVAAEPTANRWAPVAIPARGPAGHWVLAHMIPADTAVVGSIAIAIDGTLYAYANAPIAPPFNVAAPGLFRSVDGGRRWTRLIAIPAGATVVDIVTCRVSAAVVYYATPTAVFKSTNAGATFVRLIDAPLGHTITSIDVAPGGVAPGAANVVVMGTAITNNATVFTLNEGVLPHDLRDMTFHLPGPAIIDSVLAVALSPHFPTDSTIIGVGVDFTSGNVSIRAKVGAAAWGGTIGDPAPIVANATVASIAFPTDFSVTPPHANWFVGINAGVGGAGHEGIYLVGGTAFPAASPRSRIRAFPIQSLAVTGPVATARILAGQTNASIVHYSPNGGVTWPTIAKPPTGVTGAVHVVMAADFITSGRAWATASGNEAGVSYTADFGITWNQLGLINTAIVAPVEDLSFSGATRFMATVDAADDASYWRFDGTNWERVFTRLVATDPIIEVSPHFATDRTVFLSDLGHTVIWRSTNDGQTWAPQPTPVPVAITGWVVINPTTVIAGGAAFVYRTINNGLIWHPHGIAGAGDIISLVLSPGFAVAGAADAGHILAGDNTGRVFRSTNAGVTWAAVGPVLPPPATGAVVVAFDSAYAANSIVYATAAGGGVYRFTIGVSPAWTRIDAIAGLPAGVFPVGVGTGLVVSADGTLYATDSVAGEGISRSLDPTVAAPFFERANLDALAPVTLTGLWLTPPNVLWAIRTDAVGVWTYTDAMAVPVVGGVAAPITPTSATFGWAALPPATNYTVALNTRADFHPAFGIAVPPPPGGFNATTVTGLTPGTTYFWRVRVLEQSPLRSRWSATWTFTTGLLAPAEPVRLVPEPGATDVSLRPTFQWLPVAGAVNYEFVLSTAPGFVPVLHAANVTPAYYALPITLTHATVYYWRVRALGPAGVPVSAWVASIFTTLPAPPPPPLPGAPTLLGPAPGAIGVPLRPGFSWTPIPGAIEYEFILSTESDLTPTVAGTPVRVPRPSWHVPVDLAYGTTYFWAVRVILPVAGPLSFGTFTTVEEPVEPPPVVTPAWVWVLIAIGAVLVIVVIVLIFRTRRV